MLIPWTPEWKQKKLDSLYSDWVNCTKCRLSNSRKNVVFGDGNPDADVIFIGESPGIDEDKTGKPFTGESGKLLETILTALDRGKSEFYFTNVVACQPPKNRDPQADEKLACRERLQSIIYLVDPLLVVAIGKYALNSLISGRSWGIEAEHGNVFSSPDPSMKVTGERTGLEIEGKFFPRKSNKLTYTLEYEVVPIFHPAYILKTDSYSKTRDFEEGGSMSQTIRDLNRAFNRLDKLKAQHEKIRKLLQRSPLCEQLESQKFRKNPKSSALRPFQKIQNEKGPKVQLRGSKKS